MIPDRMLITEADIREYIENSPPIMCVLGTRRGDEMCCRPHRTAGLCWRHGQRLIGQLAAFRAVSP